MAGEGTLSTDLYYLTCFTITGFGFGLGVGVGFGMGFGYMNSEGIGAIKSIGRVCNFVGMPFG